MFKTMANSFVELIELHGLLGKVVSEVAHSTNETVKVGFGFVEKPLLGRIPLDASHYAKHRHVGFGPRRDPNDSNGPGRTQDHCEQFARSHNGVQGTIFVW